jgi:hypothetical protein
MFRDGERTRLVKKESESKVRVIRILRAVCSNSRHRWATKCRGYFPSGISRVGNVGKFMGNRSQLVRKLKFPIQFLLARQLFRLVHYSHLHFSYTFETDNLSRIIAYKKCFHIRYIGFVISDHWSAHSGFPQCIIV